MLLSTVAGDAPPSGRPLPTGPAVPSAALFLSSSTPSTVFGAPVSFVARVITTGLPTADGMQVNFFDTGSGERVLLGSATLQNSTATLDWCASSLGSHQVVAELEGGQTLPLTQSPGQSLVVSPASTAVAASKSGGLIVAQVRSVAVVGSGSISFFQGRRLLATVPVNADGTATFSLNHLRHGRHAIVAAYNGAADFTPSTAPPLMTVGGKPPSAGGFVQLRMVPVVWSR